MEMVKYSLNGKYFQDCKVYISSSEGLLDKLKPKKRKQYDWAEYHGTAIDLSPARYEEREIKLNGWVEGNDWVEMKRNFDTLFSEFDKEGTVRLLVEFSGQVLVYDVYLEDKTELKKQFKGNDMVGTFSLKIKEPNPVKKVLKLRGENLQLSFNTPTWVEINIDGRNRIQKGQISINENLSDRITHYITIAGNIENITNLQTNSEIIWEK